MCEPKVSGVLPGWAVGRGQKRQPGPCTCHQKVQRKTPTEHARNWLAAAGGIFAMSAVGTGAAGHALGLGVEVVLIALAVLLVLAVAGGCWWLARRVRSLREPDVRPWALPDVPSRTVVTGVQVRALGTGARQQQLPQRQPGQPAPSSARR